MPSLICVKPKRSAQRPSRSPVFVATPMTSATPSPIRSRQVRIVRRARRRATVGLVRNLHLAARAFPPSLSEMKPQADLMFLSGINHLIYHGCCYSPSDAQWPGWNFYASVEFNPRNTIWRDVPAMNAYYRPRAIDPAIRQAGQRHPGLLADLRRTESTRQHTANQFHGAQRLPRPFHARHDRRLDGGAGI